MPETQPQIHELLGPGAAGVPYFEAVQGPDGKWWWGKCPRCGEVVKAGEGRFGEHWLAAVAAEAT